MKPAIVPFTYTRKQMRLLDQRKLPTKTEWVTCSTGDCIIKAIRDMVVRGAPAIGITAAYGFYLETSPVLRKGKMLNPKQVEKIKEKVDASRPTAVNLMWATERMKKLYLSFSPNISAASADKLLFEEVQAIHNEDAESCLSMARFGTSYIQRMFHGKQLNILTHCNTGALATGGIGTALGVIRQLHELKLVNHVFADETRPYLQGARLTALELQKEKIPSTLIVDSMAGYLMSRGMVDLVITGADRITARGDVANKIGTYSLSVLAKEHNIPFFVAAPESTFDHSLQSGSDIPIEERSPTEVLQVQSCVIAPKVNVLNYSFDVTPAENITAIFTDSGKGVIEPKPQSSDTERKSILDTVKGWGLFR